MYELLQFKALCNVTESKNVLSGFLGLEFDQMALPCHQTTMGTQRRSRLRSMPFLPTTGWPSNTVRHGAIHALGTLATFLGGKHRLQGHIPRVCVRIARVFWTSLPKPIRNSFRAAAPVALDTEVAVFGCLNDESDTKQKYGPIAELRSCKRRLLSFTHTGSC